MREVRSNGFGKAVANECLPCRLSGACKRAHSRVISIHFSYPQTEIAFHGRRRFKSYHSKGRSKHHIINLKIAILQVSSEAETPHLPAEPIHQHQLRPKHLSLSTHHFVDITIPSASNRTPLYPLQAARHALRPRNSFLHAEAGMDSGQTYHSEAFKALLSSVKERDPVKAGMCPAIGL
ncbi:hypothetical protein M433DRAFT_327705 [Acidomyces richmondensis BFW]|nr:MAG: hypothetical protein FE78DRAFT_505215 [Acidomyces sp. 'richmondensis']KYG49290.1 hypothetical protein M433DRAFT_327705 [Acidomyces richmondensis BFW]